LVALRTPKRVPVFALFTLEAAAGLADVRLLDCHYDLALAEKAHALVCETFYSDSLPSVNLRYPPVYDILGSKNWVMGSGGAVQHSGMILMEEDEYDQWIEGPFKMILEVIMPRVCSELDADPVNRSLSFAKAFAEYRRQTDAHLAIYGKMAERFGYAAGTIAGPTTVAPLDFISDQFRGFGNITSDCYRYPEKVKAAVEAILPYMVRLAAPGAPAPGRGCFIPLHIGPFMNRRQFEEFFWPSLKELILRVEKLGVSSTLFIEQDWTRYTDFLATLPASTIGWCDQGDPQVFADTFGQGHAWGGFFDPMITLTRSKEECIDEAKRLLDVGMKTGHFFFTFNQSVMDVRTIDVGKLQAVLEWVRDNAVY
jgi:hypothetical protein